jgi:hypothetical protein
MTETTIACVLKKGGVYNPAYVLALRHMMLYSGHVFSRKFICLTDYTAGEFPCLLRSKGIDLVKLQDNLPGWWSKMELYRPEMAEYGNILFFDLDTFITGDIQYLTFLDQLFVLRDFLSTHTVASGVMYLPVQDRADMWKKWLKERDGDYRTKYATSGDQGLVRELWKDKALKFQDVYPNQFHSWKASECLKNGIPRDCRVLCFHGRQKPHTEEVGWARKHFERIVNIETRPA